MKHLYKLLDGWLYMLFYKCINNNLTTIQEMALVVLFFLVVIGRILRNILKSFGFEGKLRSLDYATYHTEAASKR